ncbi:helix-turn-helix domain-containing protein [Flavobacterium johnsoniae]|jgi:transcriptional regulator with XRE-family HTH domain|uniref:DNA-binding transcriptional regulator, XRE-family HTH domain n=1 Tax=Flavobacterium johnsoniae TaxID=986 RepID=A0A1M5WBP0_FLAJO|nr:helix-turn-helix transcriptional regulator [Flavobacterium johnsoniae]SHH84838.1 DNA-binding transcriptional regulator, XRE-family HTH domain [Flavobacterium johnsoniae]
MELKDIRKKHGLTQAELGKIIGLSRIEYSDIEKGIKPIGVERLKLISRVFDVELKENEPIVTSSFLISYHNLKELQSFIDEGGNFKDVAYSVVSVINKAASILQDKKMRIDSKDYDNIQMLITLFNNLKTY